MENKISIIIPIYNVEKYLKKCIESIINQTYKNIEIILIDDGSTDHSKEICDEYEKKDDRIKVIHKENNGVSAARNTGIKNATGKYIAFVDADDYIEKEMYEKLILELETNSQIDIAICGINNINEDGLIIKKSKNCDYQVLDNNKFFKEMLNEKYINEVIWNKLYRKELFKDVEFNEKTKIAEDLEFFLNIVDRIKNVKIIPDRLYNWLDRMSSATKTEFNDYWKQEINTCQNIIYYAENNKELKITAIKRYVRINLTCYKKILKYDTKNKAEKDYLRNNIRNYIWQYEFYSNAKIKHKIISILIVLKII